MIDPQSTHSFEVRGDVVIKRFVGKREGEHEREWLGLKLLAEYAPGLAPEPVELDGTTVVMSRIDGLSLRSLPSPSAHEEELAEALGRLHAAVPAPVLDTLPVRPWQLEELRAQILTWCRAWQPRDARTDQVVKEGARWLETWRPGGGGITPVYGAGDGNLANFLWDGARVRIVDFEDSGRSDRAFELAELSEHVSIWVDGEVDVLSRVELSPAEEARVRDCRRLHSLTWFFLLSSEGPRNPPGTFARQVTRVENRL